MGHSFSRSFIRSHGKSVESRRRSEPVSTDATDDFQFTHGRRFHNDSESVYPFPNDDEECDRLHLQHFFWRYVWQSNFSAPVHDVLKREGATVLDVGCGAASWICEMAINYPNAQFTGVDISPVQPAEIKPKNVKFIQGNVLTGLPFEDNSFDFVFQRLMCSGIPEERWPSAVGELTRVLKPGGFVELMEGDVYSDNVGPITRKFSSTGLDVARRMNIDPETVYKIESYCENQDQLENIHVEERKVYCGAEAGKLGQVLIDHYESISKSLRNTFAPLMGLTLEEFDDLVEKSLRECKEFNTSTTGIRVYARKNLNS